MTDQEFIQLLNEVAKKAKPFHNELNSIDTMDQILKDTGLDSLDSLMCVVYLCEIYDAKTKKAKRCWARPRKIFLTSSKNGDVDNPQT